MKRLRLLALGIFLACLGQYIAFASFPSCANCCNQYGHMHCHDGVCTWVCGDYACECPSGSSETCLTASDTNQSGDWYRWCVCPHDGFDNYEDAITCCFAMQKKIGDSWVLDCSKGSGCSEGSCKKDGNIPLFRTADIRCQCL